MSLTVKHLNGDTTFLLTFSPNHHNAPSPSSERHYEQSPGTFSILIDPWLSGPSTMWHPKFLLSKHTSPSCIQHLSQIPEPNVVIISQDKPDHCHEATLRQLDPASPVTTILAEPAAAKRIRGYKFFNPQMLHPLRVYSERNPDSVIRFCIPPVVSGGTPGETTISFIPAKMDVAGVHNAIGITYRPPSSNYTYSRPFTSISPSTANFQHTAHFSPAPQHLPPTPPDSPTRKLSAQSSPSSHALSNSSSAISHQDSIFSNHNHSISSASSVTSTSRVHAEKAISIIYSPHGVNYSLIRAYASSHLIEAAALPLNLLLHSFDRVQNPWWMGGNLAAGLPGGVEIAKNLMTRCWISAHDEEKENSGLSVMSVKTRKYNIEEVRDMLREERSSNIDVVNLASGAEIVLKA